MLAFSYPSRSLKYWCSRAVWEAGNFALERNSGILTGGEVDSGGGGEGGGTYRERRRMKPGQQERSNLTKEPEQVLYTIYTRWRGTQHYLFVPLPLPR